MIHETEEFKEQLNDILMHYGMPRRSGRYPWGSGGDPYQHAKDFLSRIDELKKTGWSETPENIKSTFDLTTTEYRTEKAIAKDTRRIYDVARIKSLKADGLGATEIGKIMGKRESTIRSMLNDESEARMKQATDTANFLKSQVDKKGMIDVGTGVERELGISKEKLQQALYLVESEGYPIYKGGIPQATNPGKQTNQLVLCPPGTEHKAIYEFDKVHSVKDYETHDDGTTFDKKFVYPKSMDSKRMAIRYAEDGGIQKDGLVEIRRGVDDLSLGDARYSQVRILVDGNRYIKGMAVYSDNMPDGVDLVFNTNKTKDVAKLDVLKKIKDDPDNPFGSAIKEGVSDPDNPTRGGQSYYYDKNGKKQLSLINKRADEGDWGEWSNALSSQFLAKQSKSMATKQLNLAKADKMAEYDEICSLTNPTIKKHLLDKFASGCDSAAVHLKAAALPGQKYHVLIPVPTLKDNEIYAPNYENGTKLALIRYPHGGTFEIPILTVNNKHADSKKLIGLTAPDAVCINSKVAERLSGADFDGDTAMCIPTHDKSGKVKITSTNELEGLKGFDPKMEYPARPGMKIMKNTGQQMGVISNLITDMTLGGAKPDELARAVRHSMVVIDAEKHKLDYKKSEIDNNVSALKKQYQRYIDSNGVEHVGGASTILSKSSSQESVLKRQGAPKINIKGKDWYDPSKPEGSLVYNKADDLYVPVRKYDKKTKQVTLKTVDGKTVTYNADDDKAREKYEPVEIIDKKTGNVAYTSKDGSIAYKVKARTEKSIKMLETDDAYTLVSKGRHPMELIYADYANSMKSLANKARLEMINTGKIEYSKNARATYQKEVSSLMTKLNTALLNSTRERAAQRKAKSEVEAKLLIDPDMKPGDIKKASQRAIAANRQAVGSVSRRERSILITDREWEAIQAGAISENTLKKILDNADADKLRSLATPRANKTISNAKIDRIKALSASNYTLSEIAQKLGVSTSTVSTYLKGAN